jgi:hypothetical protein
MGQPKRGDRILVKDLQLGDIVALTDGAEYNTMTVYQRTDNGDCQIYRPYVHVGDVEYSGHRLIPYVGIEDFMLPCTSTVIFYRRGGPIR